MRLASFRQRAVMTALVCWCGSVATPLAAQLIGKKDAVSLSMQPTDKLRTRQVYAIIPSQFLREIERQLTGAGIVVAGSQEATKIVVDVKNYDSGPYIGLSKTARISVDYQLRKPSGDVIETWTDACESKVGVNTQDAPDRNQTAVLLCLTKLGARLAEKLAGPPEPVMVQ